MSKGNEDFVKFLSVEVKSGETQEKLKAKVLKAIHNAEKNSSVPTSLITHPLQPWTSDFHTFADLKARDVVKAVTNSSYVAFLLRDGRVCRVRMASWEESSGRKTLNFDALRRSQQGAGSSFQVLGDEEYARQLQAELNSGRGQWDGGVARGGNEQRLPPFMPFGGRLAGTVDEFVPLSPTMSTPLDDHTLTNEWRCVCVCVRVCCVYMHVHLCVYKTHWELPHYHGNHL